MKSDIAYTRLAIAAARLSSEGKTQKEIADRLRQSQPAVSRLLAYAVEERFLSRGPALLRCNISDEDYHAAEIEHFYSDKLTLTLRNLCRRGIHLEARVIPEALDDFSYQAAGRLVELLPLAHRIGVMWGRTIHQVLEDARARWDALAGLKGWRPKCIPLCGDPIFLMNDLREEHSASRLAARLNQAIDPSRAESLPCLTGVPAYLAASPAGGSNSGWEGFFQRIPGYVRIFGGREASEKPMVDEVDALITGVGIIVEGKEKADKTTGDFIAERLKQEALDKATMSRLFYGDIGGLLIARENLASRDQSLVEYQNAGWTGIREKHLAAVARKAKPMGSPGVIVIAKGAAKARMVAEIIRRGFVNQLVVDASLARALRALAKGGG